MNEDNVWHLLIASVAAVLLAVIWTMHRNTVSAFEHGYCEIQAIGSQGSVWQKCAEVKP